MVEILRPEQQQHISRESVQETANKLVYAALQHHLGELFTPQYVKELKENEDLQKRTIEGKTYYILRDKVILWIEYPDRAVNGSGYMELKYKFFG